MGFYAGSVRLTWPLTGRSQEMRLIESAISDPDLSGIIVCGSAGVGKSRIVREALNAAASTGCEVRWVVGSSSARSLPLGALAPWAPSAHNDSLELVRGVIESLTSAPPDVTVVVGVDDVPLLDELSTFVVHQIVQRRAAKVVFTLRDSEPIPDGTQEVWKSGRFDRLDLQALSGDETAALLSATLGGPLDPEATQRLWWLTRGNVLYLRNIVEREVADGRLAQQHGYWSWSGDPIMPPSLVELIESRIGALPASVGEVVDALAVGEPIELEALTRITESAAVEEADTRGLITIGRFAHGVEVRLAHPLYGEVRRRRAPPTRLRRLRGLVAAQLAASEDRDDMRVVVRRATLSLDSDLKPDPDLLIRAAQAATWLADLPLADRLADAAIHAGSGPEANLIRGRALTWLSRGTEAEEVFAGIATNDLSDAERARVAFLRAGNMLWGLQDPVRAKEIIDDASNTTPPGSRGCIDAFLAVYWAAMGNPKAAIKAWANIVLDELPGIVGAEVPWAIGQAAGELGRTAEAAAVAEAGYAITSRFLDAAQMRFSIGDAHVTALLLSGQVEAASEQAQRLCEQAADMPGGVELLSRGVAGRAALAAGRLDTACSLLRPVVDVLFGSGQTGGFYPFGYRYKIPLTIALAIRGSNDDAEAAYATLDHHRFPSWQYVSWERALAQAWVAAAQGAVTEAITLATSAADKARAISGFAVEAMCLQTATQFGHGSTAARLRELEAIVEGPRVRVAARFAEALHDGDGAQLAAVSDEFERMGDLVAATDAAAHAAIAYRRQDLRGSALGCSTRAEALAEQCGGVSTPALRQAAERLPMTDREREIVMLIGQGLSNRAVADRLTLSVRTVEDHIYKAMTKTGTASRHELAALLRHHKPETQD